MTESHRRTPATPRFALVLLGLFAIAWVALAIAPKYRDDWALENVLVLVAVPVLAWGWRTLPLDPDACGEQARAGLPAMQQVFVPCPPGVEAPAFERRLFLARRAAEQALAAEPAFHVVTLSAQVLGYKGLVLPSALPG